MHYANGTPAKVGDLVLVKNPYGVDYTGVVVRANADASACQLQVVPINPTGTLTQTASDCLRLDEVAAATPATPPPAESAE